MMEKLLGKISLANSLGKALPQPVKTCCVLLTTLPMAFWFADPYFHGRLFLDYEGLGFMAKNAVEVQIGVAIEGLGFKNGYVLDQSCCKLN